MLTGPWKAPERSSSSGSAMIAYVVVACLVPNDLRQAVHIKKSPPFVQELVSESFADL